MPSFYENTAFGDVLYYATRGKVGRSSSPAHNDPDRDKHFHIHKETGEIIVDWYGPDDPENPYNWPFYYKVFVTFLLFVMTMSVYMGSSIVAPSIPYLAAEFHVTLTVGMLAMSLFVWAYGFGPMFLAPITEISWVGRNGPYIFGLLLFTIMQIPNALVNNYAGYLVLRFISGFVGSPVLATGGATIGDIWRINGGFMNGLGFWGIGACGGPTMGPVISSFAVEFKGWRWSLWPLLCLNGIVWLTLFFTLPETSSAAILTRRASLLRDRTGNQKYRSPGELQDRQVSVQKLVVETLYRPIQLTFTEPVLFCTNLYLAYAYGIVYAFFEAFPTAFIERHGFSLGLTGITYITGYIGCVITVILYCLYNNKVAAPRFRQGNWRPEFRMEPAMVGGLMFPVAMFWFGWTSFSGVHWIVPMIAFAFFAGSIFLLFLGFLSYIGEMYPRYLASAYASNGLFRALVGGAFPLFSRQMFNKLTLQGGCSLLGGLAAALIPITVVFYIYGPKLRAMSKRAGQKQEVGSEEPEQQETLKSDNNA